MVCSFDFVIKMAAESSYFQDCAWKILKFASRTCLSFLINYPFVSIPSLSAFLLYITLPSVFWFLIYALPLVVCVAVVLKVFYGIGNGDRHGEEKNGNTRIAQNGKSLRQARSVRRRRAKPIYEEETPSFCKEDEKNAVFSATFNHEMVDKSALIEEIPKEIREVEVDSSVKTLAEEGKRFTSLERWEDEEEDRKSLSFSSDNPKAPMDIGVERTRRLESMIARRRARKLLSLQVRRTLVDMDKSDSISTIGSPYLAALVIPKHDGSSFPGDERGQLSPVPGSAPSVMMPMCNPFDIPYEPHEEKPDLTGDSFQKEFTPAHTTDGVFCRHESFSFGGFLPGDGKYNRGEERVFRNFGFARRGCSYGYHVSEPGSQFGKQKGSSTCSEITMRSEPELESSLAEEAKSISDDNPEDHIKEVIQVYDKKADHSQEESDEGHDGLIPMDDSSAKRSSSSSSPTSDENDSVYKIDKGAILKSLSSLSRRSDLEARDGDEQAEEHPDRYEDQLSEDIKLNDQLYYAKNTRPCHAHSFSIASDMQVEVSEISSPPLTINENGSCRDEDEPVAAFDVDMDKEIAWGRDDSSVLSDEKSQTREENELEDGIRSVSDNVVVESVPEPVQVINVATGDGESLGEVAIFEVTMDSELSPQASPLEGNAAEGGVPAVASVSMSPKSVLHPAFSLDQIAFSRDMLTPVASTNSIFTPELSETPFHDGEQVEISQESLEHSSLPTTEDQDTEPSNNLKTQENGLKMEQAASTSSPAPDNCEEPAESLQATEEVRDVTREILEVDDINHASSSNPSPFIQEALSEDEKKVREETITRYDPNSAMSYEDRIENSREQDQHSDTSQGHRM